MRNKITISFDDEILEQCDERAEELKLTRSEYIKRLILQELRRLNKSGGKMDRRITDSENQDN
jgi:metal-responsive CopG/Arc/MetJ family transcriptional regulator